MRNFVKIDFPEIGQVTARLREEVELNEANWLINENRQKTIPVQRHTQSIFLRGADKKKASPETKVADINPSRWTNLAPSFPAAKRFLRQAEQVLDAEMGRAVYVRLLPGNVVYPHIDGGAYYAPRGRYHLVLKSAAGSYMRCEDEQVIMRENELWWFDNNRTHDSRNDSDEWRVHLIFDMLPRYAVEDGRAPEKLWLAA